MSEVPLYVNSSLGNNVEFVTRNPFEVQGCVL